MLGLPSCPYHFEFTRQAGVVAPRCPSNENLVVLYIPEPAEWKQRVERMESLGFAAVPSHNPYWDRLGRTFEDPDGYRVVLQREGWGKMN